MSKNGYTDPSQETLANGMPVASVMRNPTLKGVIVSPAGVDGRSTGFDPHDRSNIDINIVNPDGTKVQTLHVAQLTKNALRHAVDAAKHKVPGNDIASVRERAAMAFEELAALSPGLGGKKAAVVVPPAPPPVPQAMPATTAEVDRSYSPMAAFGLNPATSAAGSTAQKPAIVPAVRKSGPPTQRVYFEKYGLGTVPALFHDVIIELFADDSDGGFIVLVYDLGFEQAMTRWFPPADDPYKRPWAMQVQDENKLYLVHTTGFQFVYDNHEFCLLNVEKAINAENA